MKLPEAIPNKHIHKPYVEVDPMEAKARLDAGEGILVDVRTDTERIEDGAVNNSQSIDYRSGNFEEKLNRLDKKKCYIIHCHGGGRSSQTVALMRELGFSDVHNLKGGIERWKKEGLPVEK